jgi:DNA (cytosine-5)-methyltransferase 1
LFAGVGGASEGLKAAGYHGSWAIEYNQGAIDILKANHEIDRIIHRDVCEVDYGKLPEVNLLWASPPCPSFSRANHKAGETEHDIELARAIIAAANRTRSLIIENVPAYRKSDSYSKIQFALINSGFSHSKQLTINAADHGNPSSRTRFYAIFSRSPINNVQLPQSQSYWFGNLLDAASYWEMSTLTPSQIKAIDNAEIDPLICTPFAIERCGYYGSPKLISASLTFPCLKAHSGHDGKNPKLDHGKIGSYRRQYDFVHTGKAYALTPRLMGMLMGFPIDYNWGGNRAQAVAGIGNAVAVTMAQLLAQLI